MNDDQFLLANAYLDGELTNDERRIAEADPAVMAEVESLRDLQALVGDVPEPEPEAREAAIDAAMAEFARRDVAMTTTMTTTMATTMATTAATSVRPANRSFSSRYLAIAAAVVAIGLLGVIVANVGSQGDDDSAADVADRDFPESVTDEAPPTEATTEATADDAADAGDAAGTAVAEEMSDEMSLEMASDMSSDMSAELADTAQDTSSNAATVMTAEPTGDIDPAYDTAQIGDRRPAIDVEAPITGDLQLGAFGTYLLEEQFAGRLPATPNTRCPPELNILDEQVIVLNGTDTDVYIAVQEIEQRVLAVDRQTCSPVVDGPLFTPDAP